MMHDDDDFEHEHYDAFELPGQASEQTMQQLSLTLDVGSRTTKLVFSRIHLVRRGELLNTHYVVVLREVLHRAPVLMTPYAFGQQLDAAKLAAFVDEAYSEVQLRPEDIETGAIVLTGTASSPDNAGAISRALASGSRLICAPTSPNLAA